MGNPFEQISMTDMGHYGPRMAVPLDGKTDSNPPNTILTEDMLGKNMECQTISA